MADAVEANPAEEGAAAPVELKETRQDSAESVGGQPRTTARRQQRREDAEKQAAAAQTKQGGSWGWGSMWSAVSDFGAAVADKVIDALDKVEEKLDGDQEEPPKPTLSQILHEARERPAQPASPPAGEGQSSGAEPGTPSLSQLLREAATREEQAAQSEPSLLAVVGEALETIVAPTGLQGIGSALAHSGVAAVETLTHAATAVFGSDKPEAESMLTAAMDEHMGLVHLNALSLLAETLTEENRARPMTADQQVAKTFLRDVEMIQAALDGDSDAPDEPATSPAVDRLCASLAALGPHVNTDAARAVHAAATAWADAFILTDTPREEIRTAASKEATIAFARVSSAVIEQLHKTGETWALRNVEIGARDRALVQADLLHDVLTATAAELDFLASLFSDVVLQTAVESGGVSDEDEHVRTTIMLDSAGSMDLVRTAVSHFSPILQAELWDAVDASMEEERDAAAAAAEGAAASVDPDSS